MMASKQPEAAGHTKAQQLLQSLTLADLKEPVIRIENCNFLASYNWTNDTSKPTIYVPGAPARFVEPTLPLKSQKGSIEVDVGEDLQENKVQPLIPLFAALSVSISS
jgi:hypothetical protein